MKPTSSFSSPSSLDHCGGGGGGGRGDGSTTTTTAGCLSRILRRILCFSGLPLCPLDRFKEEEREGEAVIGAPGATLGVVARLMGLDSIPRVGSIEETRLSSGQADPFKTLRSPRLRPPRGSIPAYRELEDDNFFILSFEGSRRRRSSRNSCKKIEKNTKNLAKRDCLAAKITFENEDESENSSPNSVLEFVGFSADQESTSPEEISRLANSKLRRPLSEELDNCGDSKQTIMLDRLDLEGGNLVRLRHNYSERLDEVGEMAAMDTMRSSWLHEEILQNKHCFMEIGRDIASNVFDHLLEELVINFF